MSSAPAETMGKRKKLSNSTSTGNKGAHFEARVQASFLALMLCGGYAPILQCWPIKEIKLQGRVDGYATDDFILFSESPQTTDRERLLGQVKLSVEFTLSDQTFGEVIQAAWDDFKNPTLFTQAKDKIVLITGPLSREAARTVPWILDQAKSTSSVDTFLEYVERAKFSPRNAHKRLGVFKHHLKQANGGVALADDEWFSFLRHFYVLVCDLDEESGFVSSLINSYIGQFQQVGPERIWSRLIDWVQTWNARAGTITFDRIPDDIRNDFKHRSYTVARETNSSKLVTVGAEIAAHPAATLIACSLLVGSWNEESNFDKEGVSQLLRTNYDDWLKSARELIGRPSSPLKLKDGVWKVVDRPNMLGVLGSRIFDQDLEAFERLADKVLQEPDPALKFRTNQRYTANLYGNVLQYSYELRQGIAEGLAIVANNPNLLVNCSHGKAAHFGLLSIRRLLANADWIRWSSLDRQLPTLAEVSPREFLDAVEQGLESADGPFDVLFAQEVESYTSRSNLTGLLWALEGLAWEESLLVRVCMALAELAHRDPGGRSANRPLNSLVTILLSWYPQTLAPPEKQRIAVNTILKNRPEVGWRLLVALLPAQMSTTIESHRPKWRNVIPEDWVCRAPESQYLEQSTFYSELAITTAGNDPSRLLTLVEHLPNLPSSKREQLLSKLGSTEIVGLPEEDRLPVWESLSRFLNIQRRFVDSDRGLTDPELLLVEQTCQKLAPNNLLLRYQPLFSSTDFELFESDDNYESATQKLSRRRDLAILEVYQQNGMKGVYRLAEMVTHPWQVGFALGAISSDKIEEMVLPNGLDTAITSKSILTSSFVWRKYMDFGWEWVDRTNITEWTKPQIGQLLASMPFNAQTWNRVTPWLGDHEDEYWTRARVMPYKHDGDLSHAIEMLLKHGRPKAALDCLSRDLNGKKAVAIQQCIRALMAAATSGERDGKLDDYHAIELIEFLQQQPETPSEDLVTIESKYLSLLDGHHKVRFVAIEAKLATDPEFYCQQVRIVYRPHETAGLPAEPVDQDQARMAFQILRSWSVVPGTDREGEFSSTRFTDWVNQVKQICRKTGHADVAMNPLGHVLTHAPSDPSGLWIHKAIAEALNEPDATKLRKDYILAWYSSRGFHRVDPTGQPERELAEKYRSRADDVENVGYHRLAVSLRDLAGMYDHEAGKVVNEYND